MPNPTRLAQSTLHIPATEYDYLCQFGPLFLICCQSFQAFAFNIILQSFLLECIWLIFLIYPVQLGEYCRWFHWQCVLPVSPPACPYCVNQLFKTSHYFVSYLHYVIFIIILNVIATDLILSWPCILLSLQALDLSSLLLHLVICSA